jgi:hypothetical protein
MNLQGVHLAHQWKYTGIRTKWSWVGYMFKFLYLQFYRCPVTAPFMVQ